MKRYVWAFASLFILVACTDESPIDQQQSMQVIEQGTIGFEVASGTIEEATGVPAQDKDALIRSFEEYIAAFNEKDIQRYSATLSKHPKGFDYEEDRAAAESAFETYDIERVAKDITIVKYLGDEAHVYANLSITTTEIDTGAALSSNGRQVTVFIREEDEWKVSSVYYIGHD